MFAAFKRALAARKELQVLQGDWEAVTMVQFGKHWDKAPFSLTITGNIWRTYSAQINLTNVASTAITIDPTKQPKHIDFAAMINGEVISTTYGIYKLEGDTFTVCRFLGKEERPKEFTTEDSFYVVLKRVAK
jgi:uncharacterized protein (TIGR03067 family)